MCHCSRRHGKYPQMHAGKKQVATAVHPVTKSKSSRSKGRRDSYLRFTQAEQAMLIEGVRRYGAGNWKKILSSYEFHVKRTAVDLKDKYRNILRAQERERSTTRHRNEYSGSTSLLREPPTMGAASPETSSVCSRLSDVSNPFEQKMMFPGRALLAPLRLPAPAAEYRPNRRDLMLPSLNMSPMSSFEVAPAPLVLLPRAVHGDVGAVDAVPPSLARAPQEYQTLKRTRVSKMKAPSAMKVASLLCSPDVEF